MIRIAHIVPSLSTGGAEVMLEQLIGCTNGARFKHTVVCLASQSGAIERRLRSKGIDVIHCGMRRAIPNIAGALRLAHVMRRLNPDVLHGWMYHGNLACLFATLAAHIRPPVIWSIHNMNADLGSIKWSTAAAIRAGGKLARFAAVITSPSERTLNMHAGRFGYRNTRWEVIPNGFDLKRFKPCQKARGAVRCELGIPREAPVVGLVGRYSPVKDHANFLKAAALIGTSMPDVRFVLAGRDVTPANESLTGILRRLRLDDRVLLLGERQDVGRLLAGLDVLTLSSYSECFPMAIGEAMACGVPCVATDVGDSAMLIGDTGRVVPPRNSQALADGILSILLLPAPDRLLLGERARQRIDRHFSMSVIARRFETLYESLISPRLPSARQGVAAA